MGGAGRELIAAEYGWPRIAEAFVALYEAVARGRSPAQPPALQGAA